MTDSNSIASRLDRLRDRIREWERRYGRNPGAVALLAVSKAQPVTALRDAIAAGQYAFGENYLQDATAKIRELGHDPLHWHFIGQLQANKTAAVAEHFDWVHSIDRERVARRLSDQRHPERAPLQCCLQVRLSDEDSKGGVVPDELPRLAEAVAGLPGLRLRGLMAVPAPSENFDEQRRAFARLRDCYTALLRDHPQLDTLSMGMSADLEAAIAEGATIVRVGTAIFGPRPAPGG
jgi:hypothetical protein